MHRLLTGLVFMLFCVPSLRAQDIHFSQFYLTPVNMNPAAAGQFDGLWRFNAAQRMQWRSVTDKPYNTFLMAADASDVFGKPGINAAAQLYHDVAGDGRYRTVKLSLAGNYGMALTSDGKHRASAGLQLDFTYRALNFTDLYFGQQFNGIYYDPNLATGENFQREVRAYPDLAIGGHYSFRNGARKVINAGIALYNIMGPRQSVMGNNNIRLDRRLVVHADAIQRVSDKFDITGGIMIMGQGTYREVLPGVGGRYILNDARGALRAVRAGIYYRNRDAGYFMAGLDYDRWTAGISYDINISGLVPASKSRGGFEFTVIYIIPREPNICRLPYCPPIL
jgi:type IX secretion system PorP/SprF family membrane protein